ncbi:hypothetical protein K7957_11940 [Sphingomonas yunnanensis]|uniref:hypothetical protein n=1 Tax=Sphingomonas yunnanensis TaxID=310400 RepID=UPI001CA72E5E|nr:hypothetical protein [Sphingomonas yunnanensis]MBY9063645.1 hypothetical protein [Sphingomonas yunnanensis]
MMDGIGDLELRHGARRAGAYARAEPVIRCIEATTRDHRRRTGTTDTYPETSDLVTACRERGLIAPRGGPVTRGTVLRALRLMGLR